MGQHEGAFRKAVITDRASKGTYNWYTRERENHGEGRKRVGPKKELCFWTSLCQNKHTHTHTQSRNVFLKEGIIGNTYQTE